MGCVASRGTIIDIKDLISLEDVMEELQYGPNGGLIYCMEFLMNNIDWFEDEVGSYTDDYLIIDCPGQIELYTHFDIMKRLVEALGRMNIAICGVYLLESVCFCLRLSPSSVVSIIFYILEDHV